MSDAEQVKNFMEEAAVEWGTELSPFDYLMFRTDANPRSRSSMMYIEIVDVVPEWSRLRDDLERASRIVPRLRQRVVAPLVPLTAPRWVVDPDFSLDYHMRRVSMPGEGGLRELLDMAQTLYASPLDPERPLWEVTLVEGLSGSDGAAGLIWKMSHSVTDGVGGMILDRLIRTDERDVDRGPMPLVPVPEDLSSVELTRGAIRKLPISILAGAGRGAGRIASAVARAAGHPSATAAEVVKAAGSLWSLTGGAEGGSSPLIRGRSLNRRFEFYDLAFADLRAAAKAHECSVNDAYLAAICGMLRRYHEQKGAEVETVSLGMPMSVRASGDGGAGNQWASAMFAVPVGEPDPVKRMRIIREKVLTARTSSAIDPTTLAAPLLAWFPEPLLAEGANRDLGIDVQASNVPGHTQPRYIGGAKVERIIPIGPVPGAALMVTMVSLAGRCYIGINYDTAAVTDAELFVESIRFGFDEVIAAGAKEGGS